jgi:hydroxymethylbilane synthase
LKISAEIFKALNHRETVIAVDAERVFLRGMEAGCSLPVAAFAAFHGYDMKLDVCVLSPDGGKRIKEERLIAGSSAMPIEMEARTTALRLAIETLERGGAELLKGLKK